MKFIHKLRWQKWTKDPKSREPFDLSDKMLASGEAVSPYTGEKFKLIKGPKGNIYTGILFRSAGGERDTNVPKFIAEGRIGMFPAHAPKISKFTVRLLNVPVFLMLKKFDAKTIYLFCSFIN